MNHKYLQITLVGLILIGCNPKTTNKTTQKNSINRSKETFYSIDSHGDSSLVMYLSIKSDSLERDKKVSVAVIDNKTSKYNPQINDEYFFPKSDIVISKDTIIEKYHFTYSLIPIKDRILITYSEYLNSEKGMFVRDKIKYRDYFIQFSAKNIITGKNYEKTIYKDNLSRLLNSNLKYDFIRSIDFTKQQNDTFFFAIILKPINQEQIDHKIKLMYTLNNDLMIEDYPKSFYDSLWGPGF